LLFESLLKENPAEVVSKTATLKKLLSDDRLKQRLGIANEIETYCPDFEPLLQSLQPNEPLQAAIQCTAKTRNALAHSLAWTVQSLKHENYGLLANNISAACLHAISRLYR
jgi:hypothetical protein